MTHSPPARETAFPFQQLLPALLLACFASVVFWWNAFGHQPQHAYFDGVPHPSVDGHAGFQAGIDSTGVRMGKKSP